MFGIMLGDEAGGRQKANTAVFTGLAEFAASAEKTESGPFHKLWGTDSGAFALLCSVPERFRRRNIIRVVYLFVCLFGRVRPKA